MRIIKYNVPYRGLGTEFAQSEQPVEYANKFTNRFVNLFGQAEKRQGMKSFGNAISSMPSLTAAHELVSKTGSSTYFVSGEGKIWKYNTSTTNWDLIVTGKDTNAILQSRQMGDKLIFVNGVDRNFYTDDGITFQELQPIVNKGTMGAGSSSTEVTDSKITNWSNQTLVSLNDVVYNANTNSEAIVTSIGTTDLDTTPTGSAATGVGFATDANKTGALYQIFDTVELNIIKNSVQYDNVGISTTGTGVNVVAVSGTNFSNTEIRTGDYLYNTTRNALTKVVSVSANLTVTTVASQTVGDTFTFHKKAMPIADFVHIHYGRAYFIDSRDKTKVRVSGPDDPQDMTTYTKTLSSTSIDYGSRYGRGAGLKTLSTFGKYLVAGGNGQVFVDSGENPIVDTTGQSTNLTPVGNFTQGCVSKFGLANIGDNMLYLAFDGIRSFKSSYDSAAVQTLNVSEAIKTELQNNISTQIDSSESDLQLIHYPKRNWVLCKVGDVIYNYNYTPLYIMGSMNTGGSFSKFTGKISEMNGFLVANNGELICCGDNGLVYKFDSGNYDDDGEPISTALETSWLTLEEPQQSLNLKKGRYIRPTFETGSSINYTITAVGDFQRNSLDSVVVTAAGAGIIGRSVIGIAPIGGVIPANDKIPLSWRGRQFRLTFETSDTKGKDVIAGFNVYGEILGVQ